jgi:hypothetical protein
MMCAGPLIIGGGGGLAKSMLVTFGFGAFPRVLEAAELGTNGPVPLRLPFGGMGRMGPFRVSI